VAEVATSGSDYQSSDSNSNDKPGSNANQDEQLDISLMQTRLSDAEDANIQWAEYCMQLQNYNSSLLQQIEMLQRQNSSLQKHSSGQRARSPEYEAALRVDDSPMGSPISSPIPAETLQSRRYALSGQDSPHAPSEVASPEVKHFAGWLPQSASSSPPPAAAPEAAMRSAKSPSPHTVMPSSPLLQRLLNSSPKHPQVNTQALSRESADAQSNALSSLMQALDDCESVAVKDQVLNVIQSRSWIR